MNNNYLLQINLEDVFKSNQDPKDISDWIFVTYCDIFNAELISEKQIIDLIRKISEKKNKKNSDSTLKNFKNQLFEPDISRKEEEKEFYKSNQNFYSSEKDKINVIDQSGKEKEKFLSDGVNSEVYNSNRVNQYVTKEKSENILIQSNLTRNVPKGNVDYDENYYSNDLSIESLNSN
jgi:hypothetical protein